jgi:hypothetical protein
MGFAFVQRVERILQDLADAGRAVGIDHVRVEIKIEPGQMLAEYRNGLAFNADNAVDRIGNDLPRAGRCRRETSGSHDNGRLAAKANVAEGSTRPSPCRASWDGAHRPTS